MEKKYLILSSLALLLAYPAWADDTDIYGVSTIDVKPNVLIIFDNSGSMSTQDVPGEDYDPNKDYSYVGGKSRNAVYELNNRNYNTEYFSNIDSVNWQCATAKTNLKTKGYWTGRLRKSSGVVTCGTSRRDPTETLRLGNFENFDAQDLGDNKSRMEVAKQVIAKLVYDNYDDVRFGLMKFNAQTPYSYYLTSDDKKHESGYVIAECGASKADLIGSFDPATTVFTDSNQAASFGAIGGMYSDTYTPLAETLAEAGLYYAGKKSWYNGTAVGTGYPAGKFSETCAASNSGCQDYSDDTPVEYRCQKNYIILMTDGDPTRDNNVKLKNNFYIKNNVKIPDAGKDGVADYLDDVAYFLAHNDLLVPGVNPSAADLLKMGQPGDFETQTVTTYTIGFKQTQTLLQNTATNGGGKYYTADNASTLNEALNNIIADISASNEGFSAAAVPVSRANKAYAGNFVYYGLFQPLNSGNWVGNLKKYGITNNGVIQDKNGLDAVSGGVIVDNATSYWSDTPDGPSVIKGGAGEKLAADIEAGDSRNIYTYTGTADRTLTAAANEFSTGNAALNSAAYTGLTASVIGAVRHESDNSWPLGSFLHSQPLVAHYDDNDDGVDDHSMIYAGANDGMLHCFDDNDGKEKWGFIPRDLLDDLAALEAPTSLLYYVDGTPVLYMYDHDSSVATPEKKMIIFGERRGGYHYTALDVSDYDSPLLKYEIAPDILGGGTKSLGQSWGKPQPCKMVNSVIVDDKGTPADLTDDQPVSITKDVFMMIGGYDDNQDSLTPAASDNKGRAVFALDSQSGALFSRFNFNVDTFASMTHSIIAASAFENPRSRSATRVYAGDLNGNLFAFRDDIFHRNKDFLKRNDFDYSGHYDGEEDGVWGQKLKLFSTPGKKIFYSPSIVNEYFPVTFTYLAAELGESVDVEKTEKRVGDYVFYGTGDRAHPERTDIVNGFYAIKNNWQWDSETPAIVEAYVDPTDGGKIKARDDDRVLVGQQRDENGLLTDADGNIIEVTSSELFIVDVTDDLFQNKESDVDTQKLYTNYVSDAINHSSNRGWYIRLVEADGSQVGEKVVSSPIIFNGVIYFTTYIPEPAVAVASTDPCANPGAKGTGYLYAIGYWYGESIMDLYIDPLRPNGKHREDRKKKLKVPGIPPEPVIVIHEGKPTIITGFDTSDPEFTPGVERFYWREINR